MFRLMFYHVIAIILIIIVGGCSNAVEETTPEPIIKPIAVAGADITVNAGVAITLDGSGSTASGSSSYRWTQTQISGPTQPPLFPGTPTTLVFTFDAPIVGAETIWKIELSIDDGANTATHQIQITVVPDSIEPGIVIRLPAPGALNVSTNTAIEIVFNEALRDRGGLLSNSIELYSDTSDEPYGGTISYIATPTENKFKLRFDLDVGVRLPNDKLITVTLSSDIQDAAGNMLLTEQWTFTTVQSSNATLSDLQINGVVLEPAFQSNKTIYKASAGYLTQSIKVLATSVDDNATFTVNEIATPSGQESAVIPLAEGSNIVTVIVTAANGSDKLTYNIGITRQSANDFAQAYIKAANTGALDQFGTSVALSDDTLAVGAYYEGSNATGPNCIENDIDEDLNGILDCYEDNSLSLSGAVYVFIRNGGIWELQAYIKAANTGLEDRFGFSVALSGDTLAVGAYYEDSNAIGVSAAATGTDDGLYDDSGAVYAFKRIGSTWEQQAYIKADNTGLGDQFGFSVALSGDTLAVGAHYEDSNATGASTAVAGTDDGLYDDSGAVYVFQ